MEMKKKKGRRHSLDMQIDIPSPPMLIDAQALDHRDWEGGSRPLNWGIFFDKRFCRE